MLDLYILDSCPYCNNVIKFLEENEISYNKLDVKNNDNLTKLIEIGGKDQVPFIHNTENNDKLYESEKIVEYLEKLKG